MKIHRTLLMTALAWGACCRTPPSKPPPNGRGKPSPSGAGATIRELHEIALSEPLDAPQFFAGCLARVGDRYNLVDESGFLAPTVVQRNASCGQCGCEGVWFAIPTPPPRQPAGKVVAFGPLQDDFSAARVIPVEQLASERPLEHPEWRWSLLDAVDLDGDGRADLLHFRVDEGCSTGHERYCELTQLRTSDTWHVVDSYYDGRDLTSPPQ